jgi:hypothetical protein
LRCPAAAIRHGRSAELEKEHKNKPSYWRRSKQFTRQAGRLMAAHEYVTNCGNKAMDVE